MLKRSGRGHVENGHHTTQPGDCAVECPACPHPGRNLPEGWEQAPESIKWLYALMLAIDANFRLKNKDRGASNLALSDGLGHYVPTKPYTDYLAKYGYQAEVIFSILSCWLFTYKR